MSKRAHFIATHIGEKLRDAARLDNSYNSTPGKQFITSILNPDRDQYETNLLLIWLISCADPTTKQIYLQWLCNKYAQRDFMLEDLDRICVEVAEFERLKPLIAEKDINRYKSIRDVYIVVQQLNKVEIPLSNRKQAELEEQRWFDENQAKMFYKDDHIKVIVPLTQAAACYFGIGTRWCTAATKTANHFDNYNSRGPLYIVYTPDGRYQFQFESNSFMDEVDKRINIPAVIKSNPTLKDAFDKIATHIGYLPLVKKVTSEAAYNALYKCGGSNHFSITGEDDLSTLLQSLDPAIHNMDIAILVLQRAPSLALKYVRKDLTQTKQFQQLLIEYRPSMINTIDPAHQTYTMAMGVVKRAPMMLRYIRSDLLTDDLILTAVIMMPECLGQVSIDRQTPALINAAFTTAQSVTKRSALIPMIRDPILRAKAQQLVRNQRLATKATTLK